MLLLRTFPLSLSILWRFLLVLPVWTIFYLFLTVLSVYGVLQFLGTIPVLGIAALLLLPLIATALTYIIAVHPYLIGIQIGLRKLNIRVEPSTGRLLKASVIYGLAEAIVAYIFLVAIFACYIFFVQGIAELHNSTNVPQITDPIAALAQSFWARSLSILGIANVVVVFALRAALLPALADAAAGYGPRGQDHRLFDGFGSQFVIIVLAMLMITALSTFVLPLVGDAARYVGLTSVLTKQLSSIVLFVTGESQSEFNLMHAALIVLVIVVSIWLFCLQCAAAALSYEARATETPRRAKTGALTEPESKVDIGELLRDRMQNRPQT